MYQKPSFEENLNKLDRIISYSFGFIAGGVVLTGLVVGLGWAWKKSQQAPPGTIMVTKTPQAQPDQRVSRGHNPFRKAQTVYFKFPYLHGAHDNTIAFISELNHQQTSAIPGGFQVKGIFQSEAGTTPVKLSLACQSLCHLSFQMPARYILPPREIKGQLQYPSRSFSLQAGNTVFHIQNNRLTGVSRPGQSSVFPFSDSYQAPHQEKYWDSNGEEITL